MPSPASSPLSVLSFINFAEWWVGENGRVKSPYSDPAVRECPKSLIICRGLVHFLLRCWPWAVYFTGMTSLAVCEPMSLLLSFPASYSGLAVPLSRRVLVKHQSAWDMAKFMYQLKRASRFKRAAIYSDVPVSGLSLQEEE